MDDIDNMYDNDRVVRSSALKEHQKTGCVLGVFDPINFYMKVGKEDFDQIKSHNFNLSGAAFHELVHVWQNYSHNSGVLYCGVTPLQTTMAYELSQGPSQLAKPLKLFEGGTKREHGQHVISEIDGKNMSPIDRAGMVLGDYFDGLEGLIRLLDWPQKTLRDFHKIEKMGLPEPETREFRLNSGEKVMAELHHGFSAPQHQLGLLNFFNFFFQEVKSQTRPCSWPGETDLFPLIEELHSRRIPSRLEPDSFQFGLFEIHECQARLFEALYSAKKNNGSVDLPDLQRDGYLNGVYFNPFKRFQKLTGASAPERIDDWQLTLFSLCCDVAMNPTVGFGGKIASIDDDVLAIHPGSRLTAIARELGSSPTLLRSMETALSGGAWAEPASLSSAYDELEAVVPQSPGTISRKESEELISDFHRDVLSRSKDASGDFFFPDNLPLFQLLRRYLSISEMQHERRNEHVNPVTLALEEPTLLMLMLPPIVSSFEGEWLFSDVKAKNWPKKDHPHPMLPVLFHVGSQIVSDLVRQLMYKNGPFEMHYPWIPKEIADQSVAMGLSLFEHHFGFGIDQVRVR